MGGRGAGGGGKYGNSGGNTIAAQNATQIKTQAQNQNQLAAIIVDTGSGYLSYRLHSNGMVTDIDNFGDVKNTNNLTIADIAKRAASNGYTVTAFSQSQLSQRDAAIAAQNASKPDYELGYGVPWGNAAYRKQARRNRIATRASRRK